MAVTFWESRTSRSTVSGASKTWPDRYEDGCNEDGPMGDAQCSRERGHQGRHMASLGPSWGHAVVAAWPGTHRPRKADLTDPPNTVTSRACASGSHACRGSIPSAPQYPTCNCPCHQEGQA